MTDEHEMTGQNLLTQEMRLAAVKAYADVNGTCRPVAMRAALNAALAVMPTQPMKWQPINTANKNVPLTLGIFRSNGECEVHFGRYAHAIYEDEFSGWWSDQCDNEILPTHWLPDLSSLANEDE